MRILFTGKDNIILKSFYKYCRSSNIIDRASEVDYNNLQSITDALKKKKYDAIVHVIFDGYNEKSITKEELMAFRNVQFAALTSKIKKMLVITDCSDLYPSPSLRNASEALADRLPPAWKNAHSYLLNSWACQDGMSTVLRLFNVFGEEVKAKDALNKIILGGAGKRAVVHTDSDMTVSGIYIGDAVKIILKFLDNDYEKGSYNLVSDEKISFYDAAKKAISIAKRFNKEYDVVFKTLEKGAEITGSNAKLKKAIGDFKFTSLLNGISKAYENELGQNDENSIIGFSENSERGENKEIEDAALEQENEDAAIAAEQENEG